MSDLPDKSGNYYWRESDGDEWRIIQVELSMLNNEPEVNGMCCESPLSGEYVHVSEIDGEWLPIPPADELVELQAKAKAYDEGTVAWFVVDVENVTAIAMSTESRGKATEQAWLGLGMKAQHGCPGGYTCRKVRVCKEVQNV